MKLAMTTGRSWTRNNISCLTAWVCGVLLHALGTDWQTVVHPCKAGVADPDDSTLTEAAYTAVAVL